MAIGDSLPYLIAARVAIGIGAGMVAPTIRSAVATMDPARIGTNQGRLVVGELSGFLIGPLITGILADLVGIDAAFLAMAVAIAVAIPFAHRRMARSVVRRTTAEAEQPTTARGLLANRSYVAVVLMIGGYSLGFGAFEAIVPLHLADDGYGSAGIALVVICLVFPIGVSSVVGGRVADRLGADRVAFVGLLAGSVLSMSLGVLPNLPVLIVVLMLVGVADGFGFTAGLSMAAASSPASQRTAALGGVGASEMLCAGASAILGASLYSSIGAPRTWFVIGAVMTTVVVVGGLLGRGTGEPRSIGDIRHGHTEEKESAP
jgi:MFS family permease